jgi:hypothetical protein
MQMLLRIGVPAKQVPRSMRRDVTELVVQQAAGPDRAAERTAGQVGRPKCGSSVTGGSIRTRRMSAVSDQENPGSGTQDGQKPKQEERTWTEQIEVAGSQLLGRVKELVAEGNVRRLIIRTSDDKVLIEVPLTAGVAVGGALTILAPVLAAIGAIAGLLANVKVEVVRTDGPSNGG